MAHVYAGLVAFAPLDKGRYTGPAIDLEKWRLGITGMVEMSGGEAESPLRGQTGHSPEQGRRVRPSGEGHDHALTAGERCAVPEEDGEGCEEIHGLDGGRDGSGEGT